MCYSSFLGILRINRSLVLSYKDSATSIGIRARFLWFLNRRRFWMSWWVYASILSWTKVILLKEKRTMRSIERSMVIQSMIYMKTMSFILTLFSKRVPLVRKRICEDFVQNLNNLLGAYFVRKICEDSSYKQICAKICKTCYWRFEEEFLLENILDSKTTIEIRGRIFSNPERMM